ncbi:MAG: LysE family transporter, partial [Gammaproteobacteria bacterium]
SGARFGFWKSVPFLGGVTVGKLFINTLLALGLWNLMATHTGVLIFVKIVSVGYLAWLALRMSGFLLSERQLPRPESFWKGLMVHPANPKAWAMLVFAYGHFPAASGSIWKQALIISVTFFAVQVVFHSLWCAGGAVVVRLLAGTPAERWVMRSLSVLTVLVVIWAIALDSIV